MKRKELENLVESVIFRVLNEVDIMDSKIKNPETGEMIKISTALSYDTDHPAHKIAKNKIEAYKKKNRGDYETSEDFQNDLKFYKIDTIAPTLKKKLSPDGWKTIVNFIKNGSGINRGEKILKVWNIIANNARYTKTDLRSYANTDLWKLIDTGDLKIDSTGKVVRNVQ